MTYTIERTTKSGEVRYSGYYYLPEKKITKDGKLKPVAVSAGTVATEAEALALADAKQAQVNFGLKPVPELRATMTVAALAPIFLAKHAVADNTKDGYRGNLTRHVIPTLGSLTVAELTAPILQGFLDRLRDNGGQPATLHHIRSLLRSLCAYARRVGLRDDNPARGLTVPTNMRKGERAWASDVFNAVRPHFRTDAARVFAALQVLTGARISELCALLGRDVDLDGSAITITKAIIVLKEKHNNGVRLKVTDRPKNGQKRTTTISAFARTMLSDYMRANSIGKDDQVFPHHLIYGGGNKDLLGPDNWAYVFRQAFEASGLPKSLWIPPKNLRHTHVIDCLEKLQMSPALVAQRIGNTAEVLLSNYVIERLTAVAVSTGHLDALDAAYAA